MQCETRRVRVAEGAAFDPSCFPFLSGRWGWGPLVVVADDVQALQALFFVVH